MIHIKNSLLLQLAFSQSTFLVKLLMWKVEVKRIEYTQSSLEGWKAIGIFTGLYDFLCMK